MKNKEILARLSEEIRSATPDISDRLSLSPHEKRTEVIKMSKSNKIKKWIIGASAAAVIALAAGIGFAGNQYFSVATVIGIDVNPSIELRVNKNDTVVKALALNSDAEIILDEMKLKGVDCDVAVNALIGSMLRHGYIDELKNSILISVDNPDAQKSAELEERLINEINSILSGSSVEPAVMAQSVSDDASLKNLAEQYGISVGKATLIQKICNADPTKTFESLAGLSVNDLYLIAETKSISTENSVTQGTPSSASYITADEAEQAALSHAGISASDVSFITCELDFDDGIMVYEVEFISGSTEYDYDINALDKSVLKFSTERADNYNPSGSGSSLGSSSSGNSSSGNSSSGNSSSGNSASVTEAEAQQAAFSHAGVSGATVIKAEYDRDDNKYEIEFIAGNYKYEYEISASDGRVTESEKEAVKSSGTAYSVSADEARQKALLHAGVTDPYEFEIDYDRDDNKYEVEFKSGGYEYSYDIDAATGEILKSEKERDD